MRTTASALGVIVVSLGSAVWAKDVSFVQRVATVGLPEYREKSFFADGKAGRDGEHLRVIVDLPGKTMTFANKDKRTFSVAPLEQLRQSAEGVTLEATGKTEKVAGHEAK